MGADNQAEKVIEHHQRREWYDRHGTDHAHCPNWCEKPQPFFDRTGTFICGSCYWRHNKRVAMIPCTGDICGRT